MNLLDGIRELDRPFMSRRLNQVHMEFYRLYGRTQRYRLLPGYAEEIQNLKERFVAHMAEARRLSHLFENSLNPLLFINDLVSNLEQMRGCCHRIATIIHDHNALPILPREQEDG